MEAWNWLTQSPSSISQAERPNFNPPSRNLPLFPWGAGKASFDPDLTLPKRQTSTWTPSHASAHPRIRSHQDLDHRRRVPCLFQSVHALPFTALLKQFAFQPKPTPSSTQRRRRPKSLQPWPDSQVGLTYTHIHTQHTHSRQRARPQAPQTIPFPARKPGYLFTVAGTVPVVGYPVERVIFSFAFIFFLLPV